MASLVLTGDTSGSLTVSAPAIAGSNTQTLVATTGTLAPIVSGTAVASTSGTSIDFTGIPSWVKRVTVMFNGISTSGTSPILIQIGAGSVTNTGYIGGAQQIASTPSYTAFSSGFLVNQANSAANTYSGQMVICLNSSNSWTAMGINGRNDGEINLSGGYVPLAGVLDRVRITTVNGTDTFDAGSINILYE